MACLQGLVDLLQDLGLDLALLEHREAFGMERLCHDRVPRLKCAVAGCEGCIVWLPRATRGTDGDWSKEVHWGVLLMDDLRCGNAILFLYRVSVISAYD